jgi:hypothetical protein
VNAERETPGEPSADRERVGDQDLAQRQQKAGEQVGI